MWEGGEAGVSITSSGGGLSPTGSGRYSTTHRRSSASGTSVPTLSGVLPPGVSGEELGTIVERDKNRAMLKTLYEQFHSREKQRVQFEQATKRSIEEMMQENQQKLAELEQATRDSMNRLTKDNQRKISEIERAMGSKLENLQEQNRMLSRQNRELKAELKREHDTSIADLKRKLSHSKTPEEVIETFERRTIHLSGELTDLKTKLTQRGLFMPPPPPPDPDPVVAERPPVGTIELGEDVFTARLLLRLGFMKAEHDAEEEAKLLHNFSDSEDMSSSEFDSEAHENVAGIVIPEVAEGSLGERRVKVGWPAVCIFTVVIQLLALTVMFVQGMSFAGGDCYDHVPLPSEWWLLHMSKGAAMLVAATLMGRQLMDIVNYVMVAEFMFPRRSWEVVITALGRVMLSVVVVASNIVIFMRLINPADVWMNMTAFAFIASLETDMLDVAKRGVFGHDIQRTVTNLNFQLYFMSRYPEWFHLVRGIALSACAITIGVFSLVTFTMGDNMCEEVK